MISASPSAAAMVVIRLMSCGMSERLCAAAMSSKRLVRRRDVHSRMPAPLEHTREWNQDGHAQPLNRGKLIDGAKGFQNELLYDMALADALAFFDAGQRMHDIQPERCRDGEQKLPVLKLQHRDFLDHAGR